MKLNNLKALAVLLICGLTQVLIAAVVFPPRAEEIAQAFDVEVSDLQTMRTLRNRVCHLLAGIEKYEQDRGFNWIMERQSVTNVFLRICTLHFPTNDYRLYSDFARPKNFLLENEVFRNCAARSDEFSELAIMQLSRENRYFDYPPISPELRHPIAATNCKRVFNDPVLDAKEAILSEDWFRVTQINREHANVRRTLINLVRPMVERKAASLSDAEWTTFTNSVSTTAALTRDEQDRLFKDLRQ